MEKPRAAWTGGDALTHELDQLTMTFDLVSNN